MRTLKLIIEYDGTNYAGWQSQKNGVAIQDVVARAVHKQTQEKNVLVGASRTDAGVHALGQVAAFSTERKISCDGFLKGLNSFLPEDIRVREVEEAAADFDPIRQAKRKQYRYLIWNDPIASPLFRNRCWPVGFDLDLSAMQQALQLFVGTHDFASFQGVGGSVQTTVRTIYQATCEATLFPRGSGKGEGEKIIVVEIMGSGFLKYMVRNIVGIVVEVGMGKRRAESISDLLLAKNRTLAGPTAPPEGLYLVKVCYA